MKNERNIYALHGFLGEPNDWSSFDALDLIAVDPFKIPLSEEAGLTHFGSSFNKSIFSENNLLIGYSMGGRLALHALLASEKKWKGAVIVSTHPGLQSEVEKKERRERDQKLLDSLLKGDFEEILRNWNAQEVFGGVDSVFVREKQKINRQNMIRSLQNFSLGTQGDLRPFISKLKIPLLWIVGSLDKKYVEIAKTLNFLHPKSRIMIAQNCAHRIPWEDKKKFEKEVDLFFGDL